MKYELMKPDYNNSILNLINSILKHYKVETDYNGLEIIDKILEKNYNNIVFIILDGMGENILNIASPNGIFNKNKLYNITSVYPTATTAALTTYYSGKPPIETGWLAWSQYFKEYGRAMDMLPDLDSYTGEKINIKDMKILDILKYKTIYEQIEEASHIKTYEIQQKHCEKRARLSLNAETVEDMCDLITSLCQNNERKFILGYYDRPDKILHQFGCESQEVKCFIKYAENAIEKMLEDLKGTNTLILISADHGHQDINETVDNLDLTDLQDCLIMPPTLESRVVGFWVKENKKEEFEKIFNKNFEGKFKLYTRKEFLDSGLLGPKNAKPHQRIDDFIGDYVAVSIGDSRILLGTYLQRVVKGVKEKKSTHCGLTRNEMEVPVIGFEVR